MKSYRFIKDFTATISVGGFVGIARRTFKAGEVYQGAQPVGAGNVIGIQITTQSTVSIPGAQTSVNVPVEYLQETTGIGPKKSLLTPAVKWGLGISASVIAIYFIVKYNKRG